MKGIRMEAKVFSSDYDAEVDSHGERQKLYLKRFYRYISVKISKRLSKTPITPNQVSLMGLLCGVFAAILFSTGIHANLVLGAFFVQLAVLLDFIDGNVARYKNMSTDFGSFFEGIVDRLVDGAVFFGISWGLYLKTGDVTVWILGFLAVFIRLEGEVARFIFFVIAPSAKDVIDVGQRSILGEFIFTRSLMYLLLLIFAVLDQFLIYLWFVVIYGFIFYVASVFFMGLNIKRYERD